LVMTTNTVSIEDGSLRGNGLCEAGGGR